MRPWEGSSRCSPRWISAPCFDSSNKHACDAALEGPVGFPTGILAPLHRRYPGIAIPPTLAFVDGTLTNSLPCWATAVVARESKRLQQEG